MKWCKHCNAVFNSFSGFRLSGLQFGMASYGFITTQHKMNHHDQITKSMSHCIGQLRLALLLAKCLLMVWIWHEVWKIDDNDVSYGYGSGIVEVLTRVPKSWASHSRPSLAMMNPGSVLSSDEHVSVVLLSFVTTPFGTPEPSRGPPARSWPQAHKVSRAKGPKNGV